MDEGETDAPRKVLGAAVATFVAFCILVALGFWQLQRLRWKEGLLARIDAAERAPPVPLTAATPPLFARVMVRGTWRPGLALLGADVRGLRLGAQAMQVLDRPAGRPLVVVQGWVPTDPVPPPALTGEAKVTGYVRLPEHGGLLSAADDPAGRHFYALDPARIGAALGVPDVAPFSLVALGTGVSPDQPQPAEALPRPVNNHLQYALTWFGLAGSLLAVFFACVRKRR